MIIADLNDIPVMLFLVIESIHCLTGNLHGIADASQSQCQSLTVCFFQHEAGIYGVAHKLVLITASGDDHVRYIQQGLFRYVV